MQRRCVESVLLHTLTFHGRGARPTCSGIRAALGVLDADLDGPVLSTWTEEDMANAVLVPVPEGPYRQPYRPSGRFGVH